MADTFISSADLARSRDTHHAVSNNGGVLSDGGSRCEDKCVGTDEELDMSFQSSTYNGGFRQTIVVSKFSTEPTSFTTPTSHKSEVTMFIDNGEIKDIQNADAVATSGQVLAGQYESFEVNVADQPPAMMNQQQHWDPRRYHGYGYYSPPFDGYYNDPMMYARPEQQQQQQRMTLDGTADTHPLLRQSHDSGYLSKQASVSDSKAISQLNVKVEQSSEGQSYAAVQDAYHTAAVLSRDLARSADDMNVSAISGYSDVSEHQVLCTMLKQSQYYEPQLDDILDKSQWPLFVPTRASSKQNLVEEVKLMQHALQKYKMEFRALQIRSVSMYKTQTEELSTEERELLESLDVMRTEIGNEMTVMEKALATRMRIIISGTGASIHELPPLDLAGLHVISQMIEMLKEQVYHSNVVTSLFTPEVQSSHPLVAQLESCSSEHEENIARAGQGHTLMDHLDLLQQQLVSQQSHNTAMLTQSLKELKSALVDEIRHSIQTETQQLSYKVQNNESELNALKRQLSSTSSSNEKPAQLLLTDSQLDQSTDT